MHRSSVLIFRCKLPLYTKKGMADNDTIIDNELAYVSHLLHYMLKKEAPIAILALFIKMDYRTYTDGFCYLRRTILQ